MSMDGWSEETVKQGERCQTCGKWNPDDNHLRECYHTRGQPDADRENGRGEDR